MLEGALSDLPAVVTRHNLPGLVSEGFRLGWWRLDQVEGALRGGGEISFSVEDNGEVVVEQLLEGRSEVRSDDFVVHNVDATEDGLAKIAGVLGARRRGTDPVLARAVRSRLPASV